METDRNDTPPDTALLAAIAKGDGQALVALFRRRRREVYRFALHMSGLEATAEDVTQEVFLTVMREAGSYDESRGAAVAWLHGIARNLVRRRLERERFLQPLTEVAGGLEPSDPLADPLQDLARAERIGMLRRAVMSLPVRYREVVVLCDLQELSYADAAAALDCAVGTVRSRLSRARALLAAKLRGIDRDQSAMKMRSTRCFA